MPKSSSNYSFSQTLLKATRMTGVGKLMDATRLIQKALSKSVSAAAKEHANAEGPGYCIPRTAANDTVVDIEAREPSYQPANSTWP